MVWLLTLVLFHHKYQGFASWTRRDFNTFIRACEKYGRNDIKSIASEMDGKTEGEVQCYAKVFKERYKELSGMAVATHTRLLPLIYYMMILILH
jgi:hypothetical protein